MSTEANFRCPLSWGVMKCFMKAFWLEDYFESIGLDLPPDSYFGIFPNQVNHDLTVIKQLISKGDFPTFKSLAPAMLWCAFFCFFRFVLERTLFKNLATSCMAIHVKGEHEFGRQDKITPEIISKMYQLKPRPLMLASSKGDAEAEAKYEDEKKKWKIDLKQFSLTNSVDYRIVVDYQKFRKENIVIEKKIRKFIEAFWRGVFYLCFIWLGYMVLFNCDNLDSSYEGSCETNGRVSWVNKLKNNWDGYPYHRLPDPIRLYYYVELGCYIHQLMWCDITTSRVDAMEMIIHHVATIILLLLSYLTNHHRVGSIILLVHDVADVFLEFGKCINYISLNNAKYKDICKKITDGFFACFMIVFFYSRLVIYPFYILHSYFYEGFLCISPCEAQDFGARGVMCTTVKPLDHPDYKAEKRDCEQRYGFDWLGGKIFTFCLLLLQLLHVYWFALILKMVIKLIKNGGVEGDIRSDDEIDDDDDMIFKDPNSNPDSSVDRNNANNAQEATIRRKTSDKGKGSDNQDSGASSNESGDITSNIKGLKGN